MADSLLLSDSGSVSNFEVLHQICLSIPILLVHHFPVLVGSIQRMRAASTNVLDGVTFRNGWSKARVQGEVGDVAHDFVLRKVPEEEHDYISDEKVQEVRDNGENVVLQLVVEVIVHCDLLTRQEINGVEQVPDGEDGEVQKEQSNQNQDQKEKSPFSLSQFFSLCSFFLLLNQFVEMVDENHKEESHS